MSTQRISLIGLFSLFASAWICAGFTLGADEPNARRLVEQGIAAQGGMKALEVIKASIVASKGNWPELGDATFQSETFTQLPSKYRQVSNVDTAGNRIHCVDVLNGDKAWRRIADMLEEVTPPEIAEMRVQAYLNLVASLVPLVGDAGFTLDTASRQQVDNVPAEVVVVRKKDQPDVRLSFDVQSHLLVKIEHTRLDPVSGKDARYEEFQQDYRVVDLKGPDRKILAAAKIEADAGSLKTYLRKLALDPAEQKQAQAKIKALGDETFAAREDAKTSLIKMGPRVTLLLEEATRSTDPEIASRARECLQNLSKGPGPELLSAAVRAFACQNDPEAFDLFLAYLPCAGDDVVAQEVRAGLAGLAASDPKAKERLTAASKTGEPSLRKALAPLFDPARSQNEFGFRVYPENVKIAMKGVRLKDGKKTHDWENTEMRFYNSLPNSLFGKP